MWLERKSKVEHHKKGSCSVILLSAFSKHNIIGDKADITEFFWPLIISFCIIKTVRKNRQSAHTLPDLYCSTSLSPGLQSATRRCLGAAWADQGRSWRFRSSPSSGIVRCCRFAGAEPPPPPPTITGGRDGRRALAPAGRTRPRSEGRGGGPYAPGRSVTGP